MKNNRRILQLLKWAPKGNIQRVRPRFSVISENRSEQYRKIAKNKVTNFALFGGERI
uniref:Uncharacterized protein n=1 Tax=Arion vulgaris TaxID=1028688 RepID=A0A0B7BVS2_9EUPU